jgi:hypothetical protein
MFTTILHTARTRFWTLVIALLATGGAGPVHAFSGNWEYFWGTTEDSYLEIGTAINRTCFLSGVVGNFYSYLTPDILLGSGVGLGITSQNNYYIFVHTRLRPLGVFVRCVNTTAGRTPEVTWTKGMPAQVLGPVTPTRRGFLTHIGTAYSSSQGGWGFMKNSDSVQVWHDGSNWYIGGVQSGPGSGSARCIDITEDDGCWVWQAGDPGTRKDPLSNESGVTCLLTGIGGHFSKEDWTDGAFITYEPGLNQFYMNTKNGKTGWANCVK